MNKEEAKFNVLTSTEVMEILKMSKQSLYQAIKNELIPVLKEVGSSTGGRGMTRLFWREDIEKYISENTIQNIQKEASKLPSGREFELNELNEWEKVVKKTTVGREFYKYVTETNQTDFKWIEKRSNNHSWYLKL